ncbi:MAG: radical SAM protein [Methanomicrobiaceae archaeon]|nr:radical SAM protein [Methanomicrobiaceae archaeon]
MNLRLLKPKLLETGTARLTGDLCEIEQSHAGPGAGGAGSVFFSDGETRIRLSVDEESPVEIRCFGNDLAELKSGDICISGFIEPVGWHCPKQAYITISEGCIFGCRFCNVPKQKGRIKSPDLIERMVDAVADRIECISLTSGVMGSPKEDEKRVIEVIKRLQRFEIPIGVSIYPAEGTPERLFELGVSEVKFNLETATENLFKEICPGPEREEIWEALNRSVELFGKNRVFSNVILGLGETDEEMKSCIRELCRMGIIPVIRPLTPSGSLLDYKRPSAERILKISEFLKEELVKNGLDNSRALTMCTKCTGCDLVPGRDL